MASPFIPLYMISSPHLLNPVFFNISLKLLILIFSKAVPSPKNPANAPVLPNKHSEN